MERDLKDLREDKDLSHFNSHAHVERDVLFSNYVNNFFISTHTLTWSVT